jgi:carbon monoxide dehydrogenase subunit G
MECKIESKIGSIKTSESSLFNFLSNFNNFRHLIPPDKVKNFQSSTDTCTFEIDQIGRTGLKILEKQPFNLIKIVGLDSKIDFHLWIQLKQVTELDTRIKLTMKLDLNPMMKMMAVKPLTNFLNSLVDQLSLIRF